MKVLTVLMWKHAVVRLRRYINTAVDLASPLMFFIILFLFKDKINPPRTYLTMDIPESLQANTEELDLILDSESPKIILYHPDTPLTALLMDHVGQSLSLTRLDTFPGHQSAGYYPYSTDDELAAFTGDMRVNEAVVIFNGMEGAVIWPDHLNYTIRMKKDFNTAGYEADNTHAHKMFGQDYMTFMRLQWAIDSAYIKNQTRRSETAMSQRLSMQEFPYYTLRRNESIKIVCALMTTVCWLSLLLTYVFLMTRLLEERTSGIQELVKMVGVSLNTLGLSHYLNVLPSGLMFSIVGTILLKITSNPILPNTNSFLIFLFLILYFNTVIAMSCVCCYLIRTSEYAVTVAVISYGMLWFPAWMATKYSPPYILTLVSGFFPHTPMFWFWKEVGVLEMFGSGVNFSNMFHAHFRHTGSVFMCYVFMILQTILFFSLTWYLSRVRPGKYGQALPWNFLCKKDSEDLEKEKLNEAMVYQVHQFQEPCSCEKQFWRGNEVSSSSSSDLETSDSDDLINSDESFFEKPPDDLLVGIRIENVTKVYPQNVALRDVSLNAYQGEITVLLGHNGAGKTTLMSIITGMTSATKGKVYVMGLDTVTQQDQVRKHIGLCPQHNMFFSDLTLQQHIMFFTMLKQCSYSEAKESSRKLAAQLGLEDKLHVMCSSLSGGMKRRAQLACALAGDADVLVLDEPTSGLDVETRRELWDLLLSLRGTRTVLLSTHFMEEADALGDRVVALHGGTLRCFATTMHLKRAIGDGYRLSLTTIGRPKENAISKEVMKHVPDATIKEQTLNSISYTLPASANAKFPKLFAALESKRSEFGIDSIGVGVSTLEEVFLKLCSDVDTTTMEEETDHDTPEPILKTLTGIPLYVRQLCVLLKRQMRFAMYRKWIFLIMQVIIPVMLIFLITKQCNNALVTKRSGALKLDLDMYSDMPDKRVLYNLDHEESRRSRAIEDEYPDITFERAKDVADTVLRISKADTLEYNKYLVGVELNETNAKFLYTTTVRHAAPVALNLLSNVLARRYLNSPRSQIHTYNHPIEGYVQQETFKEPKRFDLSLTWVIFITFFIQATVLHCVSLPCRERETGSRHIHIMSGCPAELHWAATLTFHMALTTLFLILPTFIAVLALEKDDTLNELDFLFTLMAILTIGSMALLAFMYWASFGFNERYANIILVGCLFVFGLVLPLMKVSMDAFEYGTTPTRDVKYYLLAASWYTVPMFTLVTAALQAVNVARLNAWCAVLSRACPNIFFNDIGWTDDVGTRCCTDVTRKAECYLCTEKDAPVYGIIVLAIQFIVYMTMVMLTQRGIFNGLCDWLRNRGYRPPHDTGADPMVRAERTYVEKEIAKPVHAIKNDSILVDDIHKNYNSLLGKNVNAVRGVSFSVKKGECFGLLGVNGAGKSSTFKMLTAEECSTRGRIYGNGHRLKKGNTKYLQTLGYCPQFFGLDMFMTGRQNLTLVLTLRGHDKEQVRQQVKAWIKIVGLEKYADRRVESYSGGCIRRLGAAGALCGGSPSTLLDEPSAGVDVAARRQLWTALRKALKQGRSIIITSHSMDEMETLCSRIAIMCSGRVRALGAPTALRAAHAAGHAVVFKVKHSAHGDEVDGPKAPINLLKGKLHDKFKWSLKDEHKTMLHYHINETMRYSELFSDLESLKKEFPHLIEDYSVTETTLEEVFLSLAKEDKAEGHTV